jgi:hypothetical protein
MFLGGASIWRRSKFFFNASKGSYAAKKGKARNVGVIGCAIFREKQQEVRTGGYLSFNASFGSPPSYGNYSKGSSAGPLDTDLLRSTCMGCNPAPAAEDISEEASYSVNCCDASPTRSSVNGMNSEWKQLISTQQLGTGFGGQSGHRVEATTFTKLDVPDAVFEINYDSREALLKRGVDLAAKPSIVVPCPFPGNQFCKPPAGWTGK